MGSALQRPCLLCKPLPAKRGRPGCDRLLRGFRGAGGERSLPPPRFAMESVRARSGSGVTLQGRTSLPRLWMQPAIIFRLPFVSQRSGL